MDFFSAIFDNQESDEENVDEETSVEKKTNEIPQSSNTQSSIALAPRPLTIPITLPTVKQSRANDSSDSSDSSVEEIEAPGNRSKYFFLLFTISPLTTF